MFARQDNDIGIIDFVYLLNRIIIDGTSKPSVSFWSMTSSKAGDAAGSKRMPLDVS